MYFTRKLKSELVNSINPDKLYPVSYTIKHNGERVYEDTFLKGEDLTEKQICLLYEQGIIGRGKSLKD